LDEDDEALDFDLLEQLRLKPVAEYTDVEAALALAELMQQEFLLYGTSGGQALTDAGSREGMRTLTALTKRLKVDWKPDFRDFPSFHAYWMAHNGYRNWNARREIVSNLFSPLRERLEDIEDNALRDELVTPVSPRGRTGWQSVDTEVTELRRHFHHAETPQDYRNIGNDLVAVLEALSAVAYEPARHLYPGEVEPPVDKTKNRLSRVLEHELAAVGSDELTKLGRATIEAAQAVKHNLDGTRMRAGVAADAVIQLVNIVKRLRPG
jgi:hypothetical protein